MCLPRASLWMDGFQRGKWYDMTLITGVDKRSPADLAGLRAGQALLSVAGQTIRDVLDYRFYSYDANVTLTVADEDGATRTVTIHKSVGEDLGLSFASELMDSQWACANHCLFCFVDQLPPGLRSSLYFKDDDARLSFLLGQYITLTNLASGDFERILSMRISPLHISVHATEPDLRARMLGNPQAGDCLSHMRALAAGGITMHAQVVVCPELNDGPSLSRTLHDLLSLFPAVQSVSVAPVGLTRWRKGLYPLRPFDREGACEVLALVEALAVRHRARHGISAVYAADEFYLLANRTPPDEVYYDGYPQLENGVGLLTSFESEYYETLADLPAGLSVEPFTIATGVLAAPFLGRLLASLADRISGLRYKIIATPNKLFGENVTVAGLLCGRDIIDALRGQVVGNRVLIPASMLRHGGDIFLDDLTPDEVAEAVGARIVPVQVDGAALIDTIFSVSIQSLGFSAPKARKNQKK